MQYLLINYLKCRMYFYIFINIVKRKPILHTLFKYYSFYFRILLWNLKIVSYLWKSMLFSHRTCKFGRMSICAAPAWKCIQKHWVHRSSACHLRKPLSKFSILGQINLYYMYIYLFHDEHLCVWWRKNKKENEKKQTCLWESSSFRIIYISTATM